MQVHFCTFNYAQIHYFICFSKTLGRNLILNMCSGSTLENKCWLWLQPFKLGTMMIDLNVLYRNAF